LKGYLLINPIKILTILGARPQFIKAGTVSRAFSQYPTNINEIIVHTGQHYDTDMSDIFFQEMKIPKPAYFLGIGGKTHGAMTGQMIEKIEKIAIKENPDWILIYGDTNSTLAGAIVASKLHIKLAHIEAGLRSFNMHMPEEINRILADRVSNVLFCPTDTAVKNLENEGFSRFNCDIIKCGDVMQDGANFYKNFSKKPTINVHTNFMLCTIHRAENTDDKERLISIFDALSEISEEKRVILPLHPRTKNMITQLKINTKNIDIINPVGYLEMVWLINNCDLIMTDSGGLQKEAFFFSKPCITLREETEWTELVENKSNVLVGANKDKIIDTYKNHNFDNIDFSKNLYGDGKASEYIVQYFLKGLKND